jgi:hypothetical protein
LMPPRIPILQITHFRRKRIEAKGARFVRERQRNSRSSQSEK